MKIMKASAGSGKTYNLSKTYINLLLSSKELHPHRHILAVTFTNKATAEMKARILRDLSTLGEIDAKAKKLLIDILHDYSAFGISTIDKFFQHTLKAFSREIGHFADYQIELDRKSLISECMDRILDSLTEDNTELLAWIKSFVNSSLEMGERFSLDEGLYKMGSLLKNEEHRELLERLGLSDEYLFNKERLEEIRRECDDVIEDFNFLATSLAPDNLKAYRGTKLTFTGKKRLLKQIPALAELVENEIVDYNTAHILSKQLYALGLAGEFYREFDALLKEKNVMCLDESNTILRDIINGSDAPFVYEKLGTRYDHFLLDEFQDTSNIQWSNFLPLLRESESRGGQNLIVGDVKQSIYRFRDSDWNLLATKVSQEFPVHDECVLGENWRSCRNIVLFNNSFFAFVAQKLGLAELYKDVAQEPRSNDEQGGEVRVSFCEDQLEAVYRSVLSALESRARPCDIAVLVRAKAEGAKIADYLINKGISVISDDSLSLKSSLTVQRLISLLSSFEDPSDTLSSFLASSMNLTMPTSYHSLVDLCEDLLRSLREYDTEAFDGETLFVQSFMDELQDWTSLYGNDLSAFLKAWEQKDKCIGSPQSADSIRVLTVHKSKGLEFPYLIFPYSHKVECFKPGEHWCKISPSIRLYETSYGIYPVNLSSTVEDSLFAEALEQEKRKQLVDNINIFYVALTRASKSLHILAKPLAKSSAGLLAEGKDIPYKNFSQLLYQFTGCKDEWSTGERYLFSQEKGSIKIGEYKAFEARYHSIPLSGRLSASTDAQDFFSEEGTTAISASARLSGIALHDIMSRVFCSEDVEVQVQAALRAGTIDAPLASMASTMLRYRVAAHPDWFPRNLKAGAYAASEGPGLASVAVLNEQSIFDAQGLEHRPDRVIIRRAAVIGDSSSVGVADPNAGGIGTYNEEVLIIDFKFGGARRSYQEQVRRYCELYRAMGYKQVRGIVWYVADDRWEVVE